ncbi:MAG TPA: phospholipase A2 [Acidimicrobiia bacterium]|nr:phospholipase A2 [Acidimicrobiia bacterium]
MRRTPTVVVGILIVLAAGCGGDEPATTTLAPLCPNTNTYAERLSDVDEHVLVQTMTIFRANREDNNYTDARCWNDWTTDDCSAPFVGSTGTSFDFTQPCRRHDFGYRNYKRVEGEFVENAWSEISKLQVDDTLLFDARQHCSARPIYLKAQCYAWAQTFYWAVRTVGS